MEQELKALGLKRNEIRLYLKLLERGMSSAPELARATGIALTNSYHVLASLKDKGFLIEQSVGKRTRYGAADPQLLLRDVDSKRSAIEKILPDLRLLYASQKNKPKIRFFEGVPGLESIFMEILETREDILGLASTAKLFARMPGFFVSWRKKLKTKGIFLKDILANDSAGTAAAETKKELGVYYEYRLLPERYGDIVTDILVWDNKVALMTLEDPVFGTVIEDAHLAKTFRLMFYATWNSAKDPVATSSAQMASE